MQSPRLIRCGKRTLNQYQSSMKIILLILTSIALLATTGCIFRGDRGHSDDRDRPGDEHHDDHPAGVDHAEHPGDMDHGGSQQ